MSELILIILIVLGDAVWIAVSVSNAVYTISQIRELLENDVNEAPEGSRDARIFLAVEEARRDIENYPRSC